MKKYTILIVDDNKNNRYATQAVLKKLEVKLYEAASGNEALEALIRHDIDLIILDIQLPDLSGFELASMIKSKKSTMAIPIIFATAIFKSEEFMEKGYEIGAIDYILKPMNAKMLLAKVTYYKAIYETRTSLIDELEEKKSGTA